MFESMFPGHLFPPAWPHWLRSSRGRKLQLDGYCEALQLAFEYQGKQHYNSNSFLNVCNVVKDCFAELVARDKLKVRHFEAVGLKLVVVLFWVKALHRLGVVTPMIEAAVSQAIRQRLQAQVQVSWIPLPAQTIHLSMFLHKEDAGHVLQADFFWTDQHGKALDFWRRWPVNKPRLVELIAKIQEELQGTVTDSGEARERSREDVRRCNCFLNELYEILIKPTQEQLTRCQKAGNSRLRIVADEVLANVPWSGLRDCSGCYLFQNFAISEVPSMRSLGFLEAMRHRPSARSAGRPRPLLVGFSPKRADERINVEVELEEIACIFGGEDWVDLKLQSAAQVQAVVQSLKDIEVLHLSAHGHDEKGVKLVDGKLGPAQLEGAQLDGLKLVVFSACSQAAIARCASRNGACASVAPIVKVPDHICIQLLPIFYREWHVHHQPADLALQDAMLSLLGLSRSPGLGIDVLDILTFKLYGTMET